MKSPLKLMAVASLLAGAVCWTATAADAQHNWDHNCAMCHGKDGKGQTKIGQKLGIKDLTDPKIQASFTDAQATKDIKEGIKENGRMKMKAYAGKLSDDEIKALVAHVRSLKK